MSSKPTQSDLARQLKAAETPVERRDRALDLLAVTRQREYIDAALRALLREDVRPHLHNDHRPLLREKALTYFEQADKDRGGLIREQITRLLTHIGHPDDVDLYLRGVMTYHPQPVTDSAQNLRSGWQQLTRCSAARTRCGCWASRIPRSSTASQP
jgi:hypothetical protein